MKPESDRSDISVVIPVYNSSPCLPELLSQLKPVLEKLADRYEIILVDDGSRDDSWKVIKGLAPQYPQLSAVSLMRNGGQARATLCGLSRASGEIVITMDDDLQHRPDQLPILVDALRANPDLDCVLGFFVEKQHAGYRNLASRLIHRMNAGAFGMPRGMRSSGFRAMRRDVAEAIVAHRTVNPSVTALLYDSTHRVTSIPVAHAVRFAGRSGYSLARQFRVAFDNICNVSMLPLRLIAVLGLTMCLLSLVLVAWILWRYFTHQIMVPGWTTLTVAIAFSSGLILFSLGIISEYIVRILREVRGAPRYTTRDTVGAREERERADDAGGADQRR